MTIPKRKPRPQMAIPQVRRVCPPMELLKKRAWLRSGILRPASLAEATAGRKRQSKKAIAAAVRDRAISDLGKCMVGDLSGSQEAGVLVCPNAAFRLTGAGGFMQQAGATKWLSRRPGHRRLFFRLLGSRELQQ